MIKDIREEKEKYQKKIGDIDDDLSELCKKSY